MVTKKSLADLLRNHINGKLESKFDYSNASNRKADIQNFIESNKAVLDKNQIKVTAIRPSHTRILDECLKNKGIDPSSLGRITKKPKFTGDLNAVITPEPQAGVADSTKDQKPKDGKQIQEGGTQVQVGQDGQIIQPIFTKESVSATFAGLFLMLRLNYPDLELLTDAEKNSLGELWLNFFNKYLDSKYAEVMIPLFATAGIFIPKINKARKIKKEKEGTKDKDSKKIDPKLQAEADKIKKEALEKEQKQIEDNSANQQEQKIKQAVAENDALPKIPKLGVIDTEIHTQKEN